MFHGSLTAPVVVLDYLLTCWRTPNIYLIRLVPAVLFAAELNSKADGGGVWLGIQKPIFEVCDRMFDSADT